MSLVHSNSPNWLRPFGGLFVISSIFVLAQVISLVSVVITAEVDLDFPPTKNALGQVEPFFYARGLFDKKMNLTEAFIDENFIESKGITDYHVKFEIWRNKVKCNKYFSVGTEVDTNTNIDEAVWYQFERKYNAKEFRDFTIWLAANRECEHSLVAIRDLTVWYNSYVKVGDDTPVKKREEFKTIEKVPLDPTPPQDPLVHQYYFSECQIVDACSLNIKLGATQELKLTIWNSKAATLTIKDHPTKTAESKATITTVDFKKSDLKSLDLSFHIKAIDSSIVVLQIEGVAPETALPIIEINKTNAFRIDDPLVSKFLTDHKDKLAHLLPNYIENSWLDLNPESPVTEVAKACYKLTYLVDYPIHERFAISIVSHGSILDGTEFMHSYTLFDFRPIIGNEQNLEFCIADFIYDLSKVLTGNVQLVLETKGSNMLDQSLIQKMTLLFIEKSVYIKENKDVKHFITEKDDTQWNSIVPGEITDVPIVNDPISIAANVNQPQSKQISSVWLKNDPNLNLRLVIVRLKANKPISEVGSQLRVEAFICDEIMDCAKMRQFEKITPADTVEYSLEFDAHPNKKSQFVKLMLNVELPRDVSVDISLINFGNPCYGGCSGNKVCDATLPANLRANAFADACKCKPEFTGPNCEIRNWCAKIFPADAEKCPLTETRGCTNNVDNTAFECKCDSPQVLHLWQTGKCVAHSTEPMLHEANSKKYSWTFDLSKINPHIYDICYKFAPKLELPPQGPQAPAPVYKQIDGKISVVYSNKTFTIERTITLVEAQSFHLMEGAAAESVIVDFCLSELLDKYVTKDAKLTITVDVNEESSFKDAHSHLYAKFIEEQTKPVTKMLEFKEAIALPNKLMKVEASKDYKQVIEFAEPYTDLKPTKVILYSDWIVNYPELSEGKIADNLIELVEQNAKSADYFGHRIEICRPLTGSSDDCVLYEKNLHKILPSLNSDKFHIKIIIGLLNEAKAVELKDLKLNLRVSLWDACQVGKVDCLNGAVCKSGFDVSTFNCVEAGQNKATCPVGFLGLLCEIKHSDSCTRVNEAECAKHNAACIPMVDSKFTCDCPSGYQYDSVVKKCDRMKVESIMHKCDAKYCFIDGILSSPFTYFHG